MSPDKVFEASLSPSPPERLSHPQDLCVALNTPNTLRVPCDPNLPPPSPLDPKRWFKAMDHMGLREGAAKDDKNPWAMKPVEVSEGNEVMYLVGVDAILKAMKATMESAAMPGRANSFIYLLGYSLADREVWNILSRAATAGVQVRAMLWKNQDEKKRVWVEEGTLATLELALGVRKGENQPAVEFINSIPFPADAAAIHDDRTLAFGSHHQKILVVHDGDELAAFCGSMDIGNNLFELQCRFKGPAARDLLSTFLSRWHEHPAHVEIDKLKNSLYGWDLWQKSAAVLLPPAGRQYVQIGYTYGNGAKHEGIAEESVMVPSSYGYAFAPHGEMTAKEMILHAIGQAKRFIYMEDQYLVSTEIREALQGALNNNIKHLTILIAEYKKDLADRVPQIGFRRSLFIAPLKQTGGERVRVFYRKDAYIHPKLYIMDDEFAILGSANCNRRSLTHDSEVMAAICDQTIDEVYGFSFAHRLRIALWAEHLNMKTPEGLAELADGVASAVHWLKLPPEARMRIAPYPWDAYAGDGGATVTWDRIVDPDGS